MPKSEKKSETTLRRPRRLAAAAVVLALLIFSTALPIVIGRGGDDFELQTASVLAGPGDSHAISEPIAIKGVEGLVITRGVLTLSPRRATEMTGREAARMLASGRAHLALDKAQVVFTPDPALRNVRARTMRSLDRAASTVTDGATPDPSIALGPLLAALSRHDFEALTLTNSTLRVDTGGGNIEIFSDANVEILRTRQGLVTAKGTFQARGRPLSIDASLAIGASGITNAPLKATIKSKLVDFTIDGTLTLGETNLLRGESTLAIADARTTARWLGFGWPAGPGLKNFQASGMLEWNGQTIAFQRAHLKMDGNEANGTVSFRNTRNRPTINGTLALNTLDLSAYINGWLSAGEQSGPYGSSRRAFALPMARLLDADLRISADRVTANGMELGRAAAALTVKEGKLLADVAELELFGSRVSGLLSIDCETVRPKFALKARLAGVDLGPLGRTLMGNAILQGHGDLVADLHANGETNGEIARSISGKLGLTMQNGGRIGLDFRGLRQVAGKGPILGWAPARRSTTAIEKLDARLVLSDGNVLADGVSAFTTDGQLIATGGANISTGLIDIKVSLGNRRAHQSERSALALEPLRDIVMMRGTWDKPMFSYEAASHPHSGSVPTGSLPDNRTARTGSPVGAAPSTHIQAKP